MRKVVSGEFRLDSRTIHLKSLSVICMIFQFKSMLMYAVSNYTDSLMRAYESLSPKYSNCIDA